jgi:2'-5' RNA ligase
MSMTGDLFSGGDGGGGGVLGHPSAWFGAGPPGAVFFAINPDASGNSGAEAATRLLVAEHRLSGSPFPPERRHVSLLEIGYFPDLRPEVLEAACRVAASLTEPPFEIGFDRAASFSGKAKRPVVLFGGDRVGGAKAFQQVLVGKLKAAGLPFKAKQYTPHMTLIYDRRVVTEQPVAPVRWIAREFVLIHNLYGLSRHVPLARWTLHG